ncbi:MAG: 2-oxoglutarate dehydrogenase complex dihydrolipoyllysine-residue succinyltransferase [Deltaproteobacteria bacterium]|jgi:2-oxoglutarate dehydrogenase E2 component (dihydrolipoamide succinyltransferase)|nr:2-oxoglutarate dehydrogenase complex dihydrolipoyllysine-residue succinyltransferase [Deltaproteobacteria bacterium]
MATDVKVPPVGESITEAVVVEWLVPVGTYVKVDQELVALETDKITVNVPSPVAGVLVEHVAKVDAKVEIGAIIARIDESATAGAPAPKAEAKPAAPVAPAAPTPVAAPAAAPVAAPAKAEHEAVALMPAVRRLLEENGLTASQVRGTGPGGRILKEDVLNYLASRNSAPVLPPQPARATPAPAIYDSADGDHEEVVPMSKLRQTIARRLVEAQHTAAILTTFNEIDMSAVMALRNTYKDGFEKTHGVKLGFLGFFAKAVVEALKAYPSVNAEVRGDAIVYKQNYHLGVAVGGGKGLVVPVVRNVDRLSFAEFEKNLGALADKAKSNSLVLSDLAGGTFTISNGGVYGSLLSTPIINPPQVAILGLHKIEDRPVAVNGKVEIRPMMYVALSYDHRIIDGREAVSFLVKVKQGLEDPARILLEV